nr:nucleolar protein 58-like [Tanacetum cinerariifolium]
MMRQNKNLMDINIDALYNILKKNQGDVNDAMGSKKKIVAVTSDPLALIAEKMKVSKSKEKVVVSSDSEGSETDDFNELKKITTLLAKDFNLRKFYSKPTNNNLRTSSTSQSANKKQEFVKTGNKKVEKKNDEKKRDMSRVKCYNCKKEGHFAKDFKKVKVKDYEYYKTKILLVKKDKNEQVLLAEDQAWMESSNDSDQEINANMVSYYLSESESEFEFETLEYYDNSTNYGLFVNNDDDKENFHDAVISASENFIDNHIDSQKDYDNSDVDHNDYEEKDQLVDKLIRNFNKNIVKCQNCVEKANQQSKDFENQNKDLQDKYDVLQNQTTTFEMNNKELNEQLKELIEKNNDLLAQTKDLEIEKCLERLNVYENKLHKMGQTNQTVHMIMPSKDNQYNGRKGIGFENPSYFEKAKDLRPTLYDSAVIGLGYTSMFLTHSDKTSKIKKFKRSRESKIEFAYDYGNLNASYVNEKINFKDDYFKDIINPDFEKIDSSFQQTSSLKPYVPNVILEKIIIYLKDEVVNLLEKEKVNLETIESIKSKGFESSETVISEPKNQNENDCLVVEKECDKVENSKVIAPVMFKLNVSQCVSPISMSKSSCDSNNVEIELKRKRRKRKLSKQNVKQVDNDVSRANNDFVHLLDLDTFSSVRRPKNSGVIWKKKGSSNTSNVGLSAVSVLNLNKNVKRYSRKDLLACNNSHLGVTRSAFVCNDAMNVSCDSRMNDLHDDNNFFIFDDVNVRISPVSKMPFRKKPCDSMNVRTKSNMVKSLPRTVHKWLPKLQPLAEPIAKWFP